MIKHNEFYLLLFSIIMSYTAIVRKNYEYVDDTVTPIFQ